VKGTEEDQREEKNQYRFPNVGPVKASKERVVSDFVNAISAESGLGCRDEAGDEVPGLVGHVEFLVLSLIDGTLEDSLPVEHVGPDVLHACGGEGRVTGEKLKEDAAETPEVNPKIVPLPLHDLRCHVIGGADKGEVQAVIVLEVLEVALPSDDGAVP